MDIIGYREKLGVLNELYPNCGTLTVEECARFLKCDVRTVRSMMHRATEPLPAVYLTKTKRPKVVIDKSSLARWLCKMERSIV